jgi:hypothetical protein
MAHPMYIVLAHYMAHSGALLSIIQWRTRWLKEVRYWYVLYQWRITGAPLLIVSSGVIVVAHH